MDKHAAFRQWMRVFAVRMRVGILLCFVASVIYADLTNNWKELYAVMPFGLMLIPGYLEWPFEVRWPQHPAFRMILLMMPMATPACFIGAYNRFGLNGAFWFTGTFLLFEVLSLAFMALWLKRAGLKP